MIEHKKIKWFILACYFACIIVVLSVFQTFAISKTLILKNKPCNAFYKPKGDHTYSSK